MKNQNNFDENTAMDSDSDDSFIWSDTEVQELLYNLDVSAKLDANKLSCFGEE